MRRKADMDIVEMRRDMREMKHNVKCLHDSVDQFYKLFKEEYEPFLKIAIDDQIYWSKLKSDIVTHTAKGLVWALIVGMAVATVYAAKAYLIHLAAGIGFVKGKGG